MYSKKAVIEQVVLCPICILFGYISASLLMFNEVTYIRAFTVFPEITLMMVCWSISSYALISLVLRTKARGYVRELFRIFEPFDTPDGLYVVCGAIVFFVMYMLILHLIPLDYPSHTNAALSFDWRHIFSSIKLCSYPLWHCSVNLVMNVLRIPSEYAAALVSAGFFTAEFCVIRNMVIHYNRDIAEKKLKYLDLIAFSVMFVQPIYFPWFNDRQIQGQGTPNMWHSPTFASCSPFVIICTFLFINLMKSFRENRKIAVMDFVRSGLFLLLSVTAKPSFFQIFIPAVAILFIIMLIQTKGKSLLFSLRYVISCIPAGMWCVFAFLVNFISEDTNGGNSVGVGFFEVWKIWSSNVLFSFVIGAMFPLVYFIIYKEKAVNSDMSIVLLCLFCGVLESALLKETGDRFYDANFFWGYYSALSLLYVMCSTQYFSGMLREKVKSKKYLIPLGVYSLNILFGISYYFRLFTQKINM